MRSRGRLGLIWDGLRPLDPVRSIKVKLGVLVASTAIFTAGMTYYGVIVLQMRARYGLSIAVLVSLAAAVVLGHGMTAPLRQMTRAAQDLAAGRDSGPVRATSRDEVGDLARAFIAMSHRLAAADTQRRELLANVSHEVRTPVAALRAQIENLVDGVRPADGAALDEALAQVEDLSRLLDDLLDLARAEGGAVPLRRTWVDLADLISSVVREVEAARPGLFVDVRLTPPYAGAQLDPYRFRQVIMNLVDNAARHARSGPVIVTAHASPGGGLLLEVIDDGPGIPPERRETVFERFRGSTGEIIAVAGPGDPGTRRDGGTGLGLAIVRWAVALHGGTVAVLPAVPGEAGPDGTGCRIRVEVPAISTESPRPVRRIPASGT